MALILPVMMLILGAAYTGWDAMRQTIGLSSATRAGVIMAANDLQNSKSASDLLDATAAINAEEGVNGLFTYSGEPGKPPGYVCTNNCVSLTTSAPGISGVATFGLVTITITRSVGTDLPIVPGINVAAHATARYQ